MRNLIEFYSLTVDFHLSVSTTKNSESPVAVEAAEISSSVKSTILGRVHSLSPTGILDEGGGGLGRVVQIKSCQERTFE